MVKIKNLKKSFAFVLVFIFVVSLVPVRAFNVNATEINGVDSITTSTSNEENLNNNSDSSFCAQVITPAISLNGECKEFPTPCDVPTGWKKVNKCTKSSINNKYTDGTIIQEEGKPEIYVIEKGERRHIEDPNTFVNLGYDWRNIVKVKHDIVDLYKNGTPLGRKETGVGKICAQVITPAISLNGECKEFPTPCDVPTGWKKVNKCTKSSINNKYTDGTIIQEEGKPEIYVIEKGERRHIEDPNTFVNLGYDWRNIVKVKHDIVDLYKNGTPLGRKETGVGKICAQVITPAISLNGECKEFPTPCDVPTGWKKVNKCTKSSINNKYTDGTIIQEEGKPEIYVIEKGERRHIEDPNTFVNLGYDWRNIVKVKHDIVDLYKNGTPLGRKETYSEGTLIRVVGNPRVYVIKDGERLPISDIKLFNARKYDWNKILVVNKKQADKFAIGKSLLYPDGSLLRSKNGKVYRINHGKKQWIRSEDDFRKAGYKFEKVIDVVDSALKDFED